MDGQSRLRQTVAEFFGSAPGRIGPDFPLAGKPVESSLARARFYAAIQHRLGVRNPAMYAARTYGELEAAVYGTTAAVAIPLQPASAQNVAQAGAAIRHEIMGLGSRVSCGIDIEMVDHFPEAGDYWEEVFYKTSFTPAEIAYCLMQENPRMHFAARWCAKEALRKCDSTYLHDPSANLEVGLTDMGAPFLRHHVDGAATMLPFAVSISHTPHSAVAVVLRLTELGEPRNGPTPPIAPVETTAQPTIRRSFGVVPLAMIIITLASLAWAFIRAF